MNETPPRPWTYNDEMGAILDATGEWVAETETEGGPLIVRAVNAYDAQVGALTKCAGQFRACLIDGGTDPEYADIAVAQYLAIARGDAP